MIRLIYNIQTEETTIDSVRIKGGEAYVSDVPLRDILKEYGTPLYIMNEDVIVDNLNQYRAALDASGMQWIVAYASKAFSCKYICRIMAREGMHMDVVSGGELYTALSAGFPAERLYFHGNNKQLAEIEMAISNGVGKIVIDSVFEPDIINEAAKRLGKKQKVSFRIKPGVDAHTHDHIKTGQLDSKFGIDLLGGDALRVIKYASTLSNIEVAGIHCHIGSQILESEPYAETAQVMATFFKELHDAGITVGEINVGGGVGVVYTSEDNPPPISDYIQKITSIIKQACAESNLPLPTLALEPGRSIVGTAGITAYTVGIIKDVPNIRKYVAIDGGMADNPRHIMYQAKYDAFVLQRPEAERTQIVTIAGKCCESGDILIKDIAMPEINSGDNIIVKTTGAFNYSMSSNYNRLPRPAVVAVSGSKASLVVKAETYDDIIRNDI